jgi:hypothetical protein
MNPNWPRWIKASCAKHFQDRLNPLHLFIEGSNRDTAGKRTYAEFRLDGPYSSEISKNYWQLDIDINILVVTIRDDHDNYEHERNVGIVASAFTRGIVIWKYGNSPGDDPLEKLGCLQMNPDRKDLIEIGNFGQVANDARMIQSTVESHYRLNLKL